MPEINLYLHLEGGGVRFVNFHPVCVWGGGGGVGGCCIVVKQYCLRYSLHRKQLQFNTDLCQQLPEDAESNFGYI